MCGSRKKSLGVKIGLYGVWPINPTFSVFKNSLVWVDVWVFALSWWRMIRLWGFIFLSFPNTSDKKMLVHHAESIVRHCTNGTVRFFRRNKRSFASKCFVREQFLLDLAHLERLRQSTAVYFRAHSSDVFWSTAIVFIKHFFRPIDMSLFSAIGQRTFFLTVTSSCKIECMLVPLISKDTLISR